MDDRIVSFTAPGHSAVEELLPWLVNGSLEGEELAEVERHVGHCRVCQREVEVLRRMQSLCVRSESLSDADRALAKLSPMLSDGARTPRRRSAVAGVWQRLAGFPLRAAAAVACAALALSLARSWWTPPADYRTLGAAPTVASQPSDAYGRIVVQFSKPPGDEALAAMVESTGARAVSGPNALGAYVFDVAPGARDRAIATLRARPEVVVAEALGSPGERR